MAKLLKKQGHAEFEGVPAKFKPKAAGFNDFRGD